MQFFIDNKEESTPFLLDAIRNSEDVLEKLLRGEDYLWKTPNRLFADEGF